MDIGSCVVAVGLYGIRYRLPEIFEKITAPRFYRNVCVRPTTPVLYRMIGQHEVSNKAAQGTIVHSDGEKGYNSLVGFGYKKTS